MSTCSRQQELRIRERQKHDQNFFQGICCHREVIALEKNGEFRVAWEEPMERRSTRNRCLRQKYHVSDLSDNMCSLHLLSAIKDCIFFWQYSTGKWWLPRGLTRCKFMLVFLALRRKNMKYGNDLNQNFNFQAQCIHGTPWLSILVLVRVLVIYHLYSIAFIWGSRGQSTNHIAEWRKLKLQLASVGHSNIHMSWHAWTWGTGVLYSMKICGHSLYSMAAMLSEMAIKISWVEGQWNHFDCIDTFANRLPSFCSCICLVMLFH